MVKYTITKLSFPITKQGRTAWLAPVCLFLYVLVPSQETAFYSQYVIFLVSVTLPTTLLFFMVVLVRAVQLPWSSYCV